MRSLKRPADVTFAEGPRAVPRRGLQAAEDVPVSPDDAHQLVGFGKHMWLTFKEVAEQQRDYCYWVLEYEKPSDQMRRLKVYLRSHPDFSPEAIAASAGLGAGLDPSLPVWVQRMLEHTKVSSKVAVPGKLQCLARLRTEMVGLLHSYQADGIAFGIGRGGRVLLGDEMGLGKTVQALAIAAHFRSDWPVLIVVPAPLRNVWRAEVHKWLLDARVQVVTMGSEQLNSSCNVHIVSYDLVAREDHFRRPSQGGDFQVVICDESHYLRHDTSLRTQAMVPLLQRARRAILLSGTPLLNGAFDVYPQLDAILPGIIPNPGAFAERYCIITESPFQHGKAYQGVRRSQELSHILAAVMIQRRKADVAEELPPKRWRMVPVSVSRDHAEAKAASWSGEPEVAQTQGMTWWMRAWMDIGKAKIMSAVEYVALLLEGLVAGEKVLVFAHHRAVLDGVASGLRALPRHCNSLIQIDGGTPQAVRDNDIRRFQEDETVRVAVLSITACSLGITLTAASHVIFAELFGVPGVMRQAEDRAHRVGQHRCVDIHYLVAHGTIDDRLMETLVRKRKELAEVLVLQRDRQEHQDGGITQVDTSVIDAPENLDHALAQLVCMGFDAADAQAALNNAGGELEGALETLASTAEKIHAQPSIVDLAATAEKQIRAHPSSADGMDDAVAQLVAMGFDAGSASSALQKASGKLEDALETLAAMPEQINAQSSIVLEMDDADVDLETPSARPEQINAQLSIADGMDDGIAQLVGMGFDAGGASSALRRASGRLEDALEALLSQAT